MDPQYFDLDLYVLCCVLDDDNFVNKCRHQLDIFKAVCKKWKNKILTYEPKPCKYRANYCLIKCGMLPRKKDWKKSTCQYAAKFGHLHYLKYLHENGCKWDRWTCLSAAEKGHLDCLKYAHENGCEWDEDTCANAAKKGHLDCLKYAYENGCKWDGDICSYSTVKCHLDCLKYAQDNGCEFNLE
jgi:hypothetical protein